MQAGRKDDDNARTVRLFRNGRSQAVRIPKEMEFEGEEVRIVQEGKGRLVLESVKGLEKKVTLREMVAHLRSRGPIPDFPGDPGDDGLAPLDEPRL